MLNSVVSYLWTSFISISRK